MSLLSEWEGQPVAKWRETWGIPHLEIFRIITSTNDRALAVGRDGRDPWSTVLAESQSHGRGRGGKKWISEEGQGLYLSLLVPSFEPDHLPLVPLRVGLAAVKVLETIQNQIPGSTGKQLALKWPNDLLLSHRKVGGVLCETAGEAGIAVGIGLNVRPLSERMPQGLREVAGSLDEGFGFRVDRGELATALISGIRASLQGQGAVLTPEELQEYSDRDALLGQKVESEAEGVGVALGLTPSGALILEKVGGALRKIRAGSITKFIKEDA